MIAVDLGLGMADGKYRVAKPDPLLLHLAQESGAKHFGSCELLEKGEEDVWNDLREVATTSEEASNLRYDI